MRVVDVTAQNGVDVVTGDGLRQRLRVAETVFAERLDGAENGRVMDGDQVAKRSGLPQFFCEPSQLGLIEVAIDRLGRLAVQHYHAQAGKHGAMVIALRFVGRFFSEDDAAEGEASIVVAHSQNEGHAEISQLVQQCVQSLVFRLFAIVGQNLR